MKTGSKTAAVYAGMLLDFAREQNSQAEVLRDLQLLRKLLQDTPGLERFFSNPTLPVAVKLDFIKTNLFPHVQEITRKFVTLVIQKNRLTLLAAMLEAFMALEETSRNVYRATVTSAVALSEKQLQSLAEKMQAKSPGRTFILNNQVEPSLLGGFRIQQSDLVTDASLRFQLNQFRKKLAA